MNDIWMVLTVWTYKKILTLKRHDNALALYMFYYNSAKFQNTNKPWATNDFCKKGLDWGLEKVKRTKRDLIKIGLIENIPAKGTHGKAYIKLNYLTNKENTESIFLGASKSDRQKTDSKCLKSINKEKCLKSINKGIINNSNAPAGATNKKRKPLIKKRKLVKIKKIKKEQKETKINLKSKFKLNSIDHRNYIELIGLNIGITKHGHNTKAKINTLDKLHALFTKSCKNPYYVIDCPKQYLDYEWDLDELIEVFEYHMKNADKYNMKKIKSIGAFIFSEGFNGGKSWSPLLFWHQKKEKTAEGELTEYGKKLFKSMTQAGIPGVKDLDSGIINRVALATEKVSEKYMFVEGGTRTMTYPTGVVSVVSKYIKEKMDKNYEFKLVYITKKGFIEEEFLDMAKKRNILTLKKNGRGVFA